MDTTVVVVFDTVWHLASDTVNIALADRVVVRDSSWTDLINLILPILTLVFGGVVAWCSAKWGAQQTVLASRNAARYQMCSLTKSICVERVVGRGQLYITNGGNHTIHNAIAYIEIRGVEGHVYFSDVLDESLKQRAYIDQEYQLLERGEENAVVIRTALCWSMREYVGGDIGTRNPVITNIRPSERIGLDVCAVMTKVKEKVVKDGEPVVKDGEPVVKDGKPVEEEKYALQIPSDFGYSTMSESKHIRSCVFLHSGHKYCATVKLYSDSTHCREWKIEFKGSTDNESVELTITSDSNKPTEDQGGQQCNGRQDDRES